MLSNWRFTGEGAVISRTGTGRTWPGRMVLAGTVTVHVVQVRTGRAFDLSASIAVNDGPNFKFDAVPPTQEPDGFVAPDGHPITFPHPPTNTNGALAKYYLNLGNVLWMSDVVNDNGPNHGLRYSTSVGESGPPAAFYFALNIELENPLGTVATGVFAQAQCGDYNQLTNPMGFVSAGNLDVGARGHEAGSIQSHWTQYKAAQDDPANNLGVVVDRFVEGANLRTFNTHLTNEINQAGTVITTLTDDESRLFAAGYGETGTFFGFVNYAPYAACAP